jgi:hypothetical protein
MAVGDLTTLAVLKEWLVIANTVTVSDAMLARLISAASTYIQNTLISRTIALAQYQEVRNGMGMDSMMLKTTPLVSVQSLSVNGAAIAARAPLGPGATNGAGGYTFDDQMIYLSGFVFCSGRQNVIVNYTAGYAMTPPDLEQACIDIISDWFKAKDRIGKSGESIEGQSISFSLAQVPPRAMGVISGYRRVSPVF